MDYYYFRYLNTHITRNRDGKFHPPLTDVSFPAFKAPDLTQWIMMKRPLEKGDLVTFKGGRYSNDVAEVIAVHGDKIWVNVIWASSSEEALQPTYNIDKRISLDEAKQRGFRPQAAKTTLGR